MNIHPFALAAVLFPFAGHLLAQGVVEEINRDWSASEWRRVRAISVSASSALEGAGGGYAPGKAADANRGTKWVASVAPTTDAPQWIEFTLAAEQVITSVAVFGEAVDNDGVLDARVQVRGAETGEFATVASVKDARSASWRVTFPPVKAATVRLLITRSGGPTSHTDVYEVELYGPRWSGTELEAYLTGAMSLVSEHVRQLTEQSKSWQTNSWYQSLERGLAHLTREASDAADRLRNWNALTAATREQLAATMDRLAGETSSLGERVRQAAGNLPVFLKALQERRGEWQTAREFAAKAGAGETVATMREGAIIRLFNRQVLVRFDETDSSWDVAWLDETEAAAHRIRFSVEFDGQTSKPPRSSIETVPFTDELGSGQQILQRWGETVKIERWLRVYDGKAVVTVSGRITNAGDRDVSLGTTHLVEVSPADQAWWHLGPATEAPGAVYIAGTSELMCQPPSSGDLSAGGERAYDCTGILTFARREPSAALVVGYLTAFEARPDLHARFRVLEGGTALAARQRFLGRKLGPGESLELDRVYLTAHADPYVALEQYGDAAALFAQLPVHRQATALWCSWYAHRMAMTEELVLANAAVAAKHFQPLGLEIMQLDHGWQRGDITGDWVPNERFPRGLKWLADELKARHGLRLGVWIAPTDVAETSETFRQHRDWLLQDEQGNPRVNWRWYWKPNPNCYELDASHPAAARWLEEVFAQLTASGVSYYKIDFIAAAGGEHFYQHDPKSTRGWTPLRRAMEALRRGAGAEAWIRYCQTPPLLSAGLANSTIGGTDTLDAGLEGRIDVLRDNARHLAAGYWLNDRWYHREVCDMSVRMQASVEEARLRLAMMTLAGCSISFSDELQYLPASRIRMMQQCLPPGNPPMKPLDLFERTIPSIWHLRCRQAGEDWDAVGLFNFESQAEERKVDFATLALPAGTEVAVFEFWEEKFLGIHRESLTLKLPPQSSRILSLRRLKGHPQLIGTDMHVLQGVHEIQRLNWNEDTGTLSGEFKRMPGLDGKVFVLVPTPYRPRFDFPLSESSAQLTQIGNGVWVGEVHFQVASQAWSVPFVRTTANKP